jgi:uncharacterized protein (TIGR02145 family)
MKTRKRFIPLALFASLLFIVVTSCNKTDDPVEEIPVNETVKDADGNIYNTIKIGNQVWMVENLKTTKYNDGTEILNVINDLQWNDLKTAGYCNYENRENFVAIYGRLYNWHAVNTGKLAPAGWHVPTDNDWTILENYLIANGYNSNGSTNENLISKSLCAKTNWAISKETSTPGCAPENNNSTGFTALPGGIRFSNGRFYSIEKGGYWWSSTEYDSNLAYNREMGYDYANMLRINISKEFALSVRLVKD